MEFRWHAVTGSDTNTTAMVFQALVAAAPTSAARAKGIAYLHTQQNADGGFPYSQASPFGNASDANSTALSTQAIIASGEDMAGWTREGATPHRVCKHSKMPVVHSDFQDQPPDDNQLATYQAIPALLGMTFVVIATSSGDNAVASSPATLPNTGVADGFWLLLVACGALGTAGAAMRRRSA